MTEYVLAVTEDGSTDWQTSARGDVEVIDVNFDLLAENDHLFLDELKALTRKVAQLPNSIPWKKQVVERLKQLHDARKQDGVFI